MKRFVYIMFLLVSFSCNSKSDLLKYTLSNAKENKKELENVIQYYSKNNKDSLKLKAAMFLIENMPLYGAFYGAKVDSANNLFKILERLKYEQTEITEETKVAISDSLKKKYENMELSDQFQSDMQVITASYLIDNIDKAFYEWNNANWKSNVSFSMFCEYILPYRVRKEIPEYWRSILYARHMASKSIIKGWGNEDSLFDYHTDNTYYEIVASHMLDNYKYDMNYGQMEISHSGECLDRCAYQIYHLRAAGVPATFDYIPVWANRPFALHAMVGLATRNKQMKNYITNENKPIDITNTVSNAWSKKMPYNFTKQEMPHGLYVQYVKTVPKVYRKTWSMMDEIKTIYNTIPQNQIYTKLLQFNMVDVSNQYLECTNVEMQMPTPYKEYNIAYLAVFDPSGWKPVAYALNEQNGKLIFKNMGKNIMYLPVVCNDNTIIPIDDPFILENNGEIHKIIVNSDEFSEMKFIRKFPYFTYTASHSIWIKGAYFEGANSPDFSDADLLHTIDYYPFYMTKAKVYSKKKYRYLRCCQVKKGKLDIAEIKYFGKRGNDTVELAGKPYAQFSDKDMANKAFDNDLLTCFHSYVRDEYLYYDLGENNNTQIVEIEFAPRNDANCIIPGNDYELFYWNNEWISLGEKRANDYSITFKNIPSNGLYWLKCHSGGKEERIFTYTNEGQIWW